MEEGQNKQVSYKDEDLLWKYCETVNQYTKGRSNGSKLLRFLCVGVLTVLAFSALSCDPNFTALQSGQRIERLVLIRLKKNISEERKRRLLRKIMDVGKSLKNGRPYVHIEYGWQNSREGLSAGYDLAVRISFRSYEDRDYFDGNSPEPGMPESGSAYEYFKAFMIPYMDPNSELFSFDFVSNENAHVKGNKERLDHWVLFKFRKDITADDRQKITDRFLKLKSSLKNGKPYIELIDYGYENNYLAKDPDFEMAFRVIFLSQKDRDYYVGKPFQNDPGTFDPMHDDFKNFVGPYLDPERGVLVFDYEVISD
ncbi:Dabb family protein [Chryseobacterium sp. CBSDS_008]|uniref:Dabb family protein n=1 Tax=Chryseobacterium sp. CBSDS_008 TaxID=3415265 RepID=UPI003CF02DE4